MNGVFITFEGGEGSGKTTQIQLLHKALLARGKDCIITREPGGTHAAEAIRSLLLTGSADKWHPVAETLLFQAARVEHVERHIKPALKAGKWLLCDRFVDSTIVYQGLGKQLGMEYISQLHRMTLGNFLPDLTFILNINPETGLKRALSRAGEETRFEHMELAFHQQVQAGFLEIAAAQPRCVVIDAAQTVEIIHKQILAIVQSR